MKEATLMNEPLLIASEAAAELCGRSRTTWWRDHSAGRIPAPVKIGGRTYWRADELRRWVEAGCPVRTVWEKMRADSATRRLS
jgi:predicted DNA-binding transcriptional regulator AlpA